MLKQFITIISLILCSFHSFSQPKYDNEIAVEGNSQIKVKPDHVSFTLTIEKTDQVEKNSIKMLNEEIDKLVKSLNDIGISDKSIKISNYSISSSQNDHEYKKYTATNELKLEFIIDTKLIDNLYYKIQEADLKDLDISFETRLSDSLEKATRLKLVQSSIEDAKMNAKNIANSLNIKLFGVKQVQKYAFDGTDRDKVEMAKLTPPKIVRDNEIRYNTPFDKFQVEDIELEEKITIVYEIAN